MEADLQKMTACQIHWLQSSMGATEWFGVRTVYRHNDLSSDDSNLYEERVVLISAKDKDEALEKAEREASQYANNCGECEYLGYMMGFEMDEGSIGNGSEVFSLMRDHPLPPKDYIDCFFDTGAERSR